ncbi:MAG: hypothetical protein LBP56_08515 [Odoribacteraceae bacterium]|jgi:hypothetical protein|nr:hypothetical protein [Odoribacteraceae bacterium]
MKRLTFYLFPLLLCFSCSDEGLEVATFIKPAIDKEKSGMQGREELLSIDHELYAKLNRDTVFLALCDRYHLLLHEAAEQHDSVTFALAARAWCTALHVFESERHILRLPAYIFKHESDRPATRYGFEYELPGVTVTAANEMVEAWNTLC